MIEDIKYRRILKKMGYRADQKGIINRYLREAGGWDSHLMHCRDYILDRLRLYSPETVTILGSGWLLDVPLEDMAEHCQSINLVDINHPPQVKHRVAEMDKVKLIQDDITGGIIKRIWEKRNDGPEAVLETEVAVYSPDYDPGLVISLNVLTQTDSLIVDYLHSEYGMSYVQLRDFRGKIQGAHLSFLDSVPSLLISEYEELIFDKAALVQTNKLLFTDLPEKGEKSEWDWDFDNSGEYYRRKRICFKVIAIDNAG